MKVAVGKYRARALCKGFNFKLDADTTYTNDCDFKTQSDYLDKRFSFYNNLPLTDPVNDAYYPRVGND